MRILQAGYRPRLSASQGLSGFTRNNDYHLSILHKLVYIPSLCKVGRVSQVRNDHVVVDVVPSRKSKIVCNGSSNEFSLRDVVDV